MPSRAPTPAAVSRLDLRPPTELLSASLVVSDEPHALVGGPAAPPSARLTNAAALRARLEEQLPSLGNDAAARPMSRAQEMAQRFRREGLPLARLFESRSALVSLGLNQRGKPGIWLIQKIP